VSIFHVRKIEGVFLELFGHWGIKMAATDKFEPDIEAAHRLLDEKIAKMTQRLIDEGKLDEKTYELNIATMPLPEVVEAYKDPKIRVAMMAKL